MNHYLNEASSNKLSIDDIISAASSGFLSKDMENNNKSYSYSYSSLAKAASKLYAVFPVLCSRTVSSDTAFMVTKYIEQKACFLFTIALQQANISNAEDGISYLTRYHRNLDDGMGGNVSDSIQAWLDSQVRHESDNSLISKIIAERDEEDKSYIYDYLLESDKSLQISGKDAKEFLKIMEENSNIEYYDMNLNPISINDYLVKESFDDNIYQVSVKPLSENVPDPLDPLNNKNRHDMLIQDPVIAGLRDPWLTLARPGGSLTPDAAWKYQQREDKVREQEAKRAQDKYNRDQEQYKKEHERDVAARQAGLREPYRSLYANGAIERDEAIKLQNDEDHAREREEKIQDRKDKLDDIKRRKEEELRAKRGSGANVNFVSNQDIKKMNDALPSMINVRFYQTNDDGTPSDIPTEFILGVKSKLIPVTTDEILRRIINDNKDGQKFLKFMRTITGELKAQEVLLGLSRIKDDLKSTKRKGAYGDTWNLLANRAKAARDQIRSGRNNDYSAITTVVISSDDADTLFRLENFDITDPANALHFMKSYNLMAFIIVNDATEVMNIIMDDGAKDFSQYSYSMLERETKDGTYKKLINLMAMNK